MQEASDFDRIIFQLLERLKFDPGVAQEVLDRWTAGRPIESVKGFEEIRRHLEEPAATVGLSLLRRAHQSARAVALIEIDGRPVGTGFLVQEGAFVGGENDGRVLVTSLHLLSGSAESDVEPEMVARFEAETTRCRLLPLFRFPELSILVARLDPPPTDLEPLEIASPSTDIERIFLIGHPGGGEVSLSLHDNRYLGPSGDEIAYVADSAPGSTGSPVFDQDWRVIGVHQSSNKGGSRGTSMNAISVAASAELAQSSEVPREEEASEE